MIQHTTGGIMLMFFQKLYYRCIRTVCLWVRGYYIHEVYSCTIEEEVHYFQLVEFQSDLMISHHDTADCVYPLVPESWAKAFFRQHPDLDEDTILLCSVRGTHETLYLSWAPPEEQRFAISMLQAMTAGLRGWRPTPFLIVTGGGRKRVDGQHYFENPRILLLYK